METPFSENCVGEDFSRLTSLYPYTDFKELPLCWSNKDKANFISLSYNNLKVHYKGNGINNKDAASVRTSVPIPSSCLLYYFEIKVLSKGCDDYIGIGLAAQSANIQRLPGWDKLSYGYGHDGNSFCSSDTGQPYGPIFTTGDVIGCGYNIVENNCFFTKNGHNLGIAFTGLPNVPLYPTIGLQTPDVIVKVNFGLEPFCYDIEDDMRALRQRITANIINHPAKYPEWQSTMNKLVLSWLIDNSYSTAEVFSSVTKQEFKENLQQLISTGKIEDAIQLTNKLYPDILNDDPNLLFALKCRQFVEMISESCSKKTIQSLSSPDSMNKSIGDLKSSPDSTCTTISKTLSVTDNNNATNPSELKTAHPSICSPSSSNNAPSSSSSTDFSSSLTNSTSNMAATSTINNNKNDAKDNDVENCNTNDSSANITDSNSNMAINDKTTTNGLATNVCNGDKVDIDHEIEKESEPIKGQTQTNTLSRNDDNQKKRTKSFLFRLLSNLASLSIPRSTSNGKNEDDSSTDSYKTLRRSRERSNGDNHESTNKLSNLMSSQDAVNIITCNCSGETHGKTTNQTKSKPLTLSGIKNHGNTCFMNAILQCLSHTDLLIEYFNDTQFYYKDLITRQQLNHLCKNGSNSEVTAQCATLFQSLWKNNYSPDLSSKFKSLIGKHCKQYEDGGQHDAQEFLFFLLDIFHEDLNVAIKKKAKKFKIPNTWNRPDEVIAAETLSIYTRCDNSFIRKVFQAQLRSSVVCRSCKSHSNTFDPYMCLSLPVPTKLTHISIINVSYLENVPKKTRMAVTIETQATLKEMRHKISRLIKIPENQLVLLINDSSSGIKELNQYKTPISEFLNDSDEIEAIETPKMDINQPNCNSGSPKTSSTTGSQLTLVWTNHVGSGSSDKKFFGPYFSCTINREASFKDIQSELLKTMQPILSLTSVETCIKDLPLFKLKVVGGIQGRSYLPEHGDHPLYSSTVNEALAHCKEKDYRGPIYVMLVVEWDADLKATLVVDDDKSLIINEDPNIEYVIARNRLSNQATLEDCFDMYFREEKLGADDAWMCPSCKKKQQCIKKLSLWSTPDILIIHLKRFRQATNLQRTKLSTLVNFPFTSLDMNPYLSKRKANSEEYKQANGDANNLSYILYPWKKPREKEVLPYYSEDNIYDLYAVCNHHGNMSSGHYTAYCRDINDHKWYSFDDQQVSKVSENSLVTGDAYILFYQRATIPPFTLEPSSESSALGTRSKRVSSSASASSSSSSSSSTSSSSSSSSSSLSLSSSNADQSSTNSLTSQSNASLNNDNQSSPVK